jgi:glycosyltransferase involved in cell wall biosynthesis
MKRALVYSPYWDTLGGGERYLAGAVKALTGCGYEVTIPWSDEMLLAKIKARFDLTFGKGVRISPASYQTITTGPTWKKFGLELGYDLVLWVSDGSVPTLMGKRNWLHFQVPFHEVNGESQRNKIKLWRVQRIICNSEFTKKVIDQEFGTKSEVIYPPVKLIKGDTKEKIILSVGRFDYSLHHKRQDVLIEAFKSLKHNDWRMVLAGGVLANFTEVEKLKAKIGTDNITLITNPDYQELAQLYAKASIYWHAAGYGQNLKKYPERAEHFGMATVEAMSAGLVPMVYEGGGQTEIVEDGINGFTWREPEQLVVMTNQLIENINLKEYIAKQAQQSAKKFSEEAFERKFRKLIG